MTNGNRASRYSPTVPVLNFHFCCSQSESSCDSSGQGDSRETGEIERALDLLHLSSIALGRIATSTGRDLATIAGGDATGEGERSSISSSSSSSSSHGAKIPPSSSSSSLLSAAGSSPGVAGCRSDATETAEAATAGAGAGNARKPAGNPVNTPNDARFKGRTVTKGFCPPFRAAMRYLRKASEIWVSRSANQPRKRLRCVLPSHRECPTKSTHDKYSRCSCNASASRGSGIASQGFLASSRQTQQAYTLELHGPRGRPLARL
jgi:hypothetical protein